MGCGYYTGNGHIKVVCILNGKDKWFYLYGYQEFLEL
jgi:hypothetical protein